MVLGFWLVLGRGTILSYLGVGNNLNTQWQCDNFGNHGAKQRQQVVEEQLRQELEGTYKSFGSSRQNTENGCCGFLRIWNVVSHLVWKVNFCPMEPVFLYPAFLEHWIQNNIFWYNFWSSCVWERSGGKEKLFRDTSSFHPIIHCSQNCKVKFISQSLEWNSLLHQ